MTKQTKIQANQHTQIIIRDVHRNEKHLYYIGDKIVVSMCVNKIKYQFYFDDLQEARRCRDVMVSRKMRLMLVDNYRDGYSILNEPVTLFALQKDL
jgi:hypothetical protein